MVQPNKQDLQKKYLLIVALVASKLQLAAFFVPFIDWQIDKQSTFDYD